MIPSALSPSLAVSTSYWLRSKALSANRMRGSSSTQSPHGRVTDISLALKRPPSPPPPSRPCPCCAPTQSRPSSAQRPVANPSVRTRPSPSPPYPSNNNPTPTHPPHPHHPPS